MIEQEQITKLVTKYLGTGPRFLVDVIVKKGNQIMVFLDGDQGITIDDCMEVSRFIESSLDRDVEDFELKVSSFGIGQPFKMLRQFKKNIGRSVKIDLEDGSIVRGVLKNADKEKITIQPEAKKKNYKPNPVVIEMKNIIKICELVTFKKNDN